MPVIAPLLPGTDALPIVLMSSAPSPRSATASIFSAEVDNPTSEPSKYSSHVPDVVLPVLVGRKRATSCISSLNAPPGPLRLFVPLMPMSSEPSLMSSNSLIGLLTPTSEPSKNSDQLSVGPS